jgi:hypothetical protein
MFLPVDPDSPRDFDFFIGEWDVQHRRLKTRLNGCTEWETFAGLSYAKKILGGFGNIDDNLLYLPNGTYRAATLRCFDASTKKWSIWWLDARSPGAIDVPVVGAFEHGTGTFIANDTFEGKPVVVRFLWSVPEPDRPRWEQAFSPDGGQHWEINWVMNFSRRPSGA